jgi:hypothetical protein
MRHPRDPRNREDDSNNYKSVHGTKKILLKQTRAKKSGVPPTRWPTTHKFASRLHKRIVGILQQHSFIKFDHVHVTNTHNVERWRTKLYTVSRIFTHAHWKWVTRDFGSAASRLLNVTAPCIGWLNWAMQDFHMVTTVYDLALRDGSL